MSKQRAALRAQQEAKRQRAKRERAAKGGGAPRPRTRAPRGRPGQPTGPRARASRRRTSLAVALVLLAQLAAWFLWENWAGNLAVFIVTAFLAVIVLGLLRRHR